ncbi:MAG UNVERIFIED_CONTAM: hypothetical protein LVR18_11545 [Planctomycetaceae bacterium]
MTEEQATYWLPRATLDRLIRMLAEDGYEVVGPTIDQSAIVYGPIESVADLPVGWTDRQAPGEYRLEPRDDHRIFGFVVGPHSWKKYLFPADELVASAARAGDTWQFTTPDVVPRKYAFLGAARVRTGSDCCTGPRVSWRSVRGSTVPCSPRCRAADRGELHSGCCNLFLHLNEHRATL